MKEIRLFTDSEREIMKPLLSEKEKGNHKAAVEYTKMWIAGCKRALEEYKKHSADEIIETDDDVVFEWDNVGAKIDELNEEIEKNEEWLRENI